MSNKQSNSSPPWRMPEAATVWDLLVDNFTLIFHCIYANRIHSQMELKKSKPIYPTTTFLHDKRELEEW